MSMLSKWINTLRLGQCAVCGRHYTPADIQCGTVFLLVDPLEGVVSGLHLEHFHGGSKVDNQIGKNVASALRNHLRALRDKNPTAAQDVHGFPERTTANYGGTVHADD